MEDSKIIPTPTQETKPYWDGCQQEQLMIQQCSDCKNIQFYPRIMCTQCSSRELEWTEVKGQANVLSYTIIHKAILPAYKKKAPYILAIVKLKEGPTLMTNIVNCSISDIHCDMDVKVHFQNWANDFLVPVFEPI